MRMGMDMGVGVDEVMVYEDKVSFLDARVEIRGSGA